MIDLAGTGESFRVDNDPAVTAEFALAMADTAPAGTIQDCRCSRHSMANGADYRRYSFMSEETSLC